MATVHRAEVTSAEGFCRPVAIKYIHEGLANQPAFERQFRSEAQVISHLHHPNIVQVLDFDRDESGRLFIAMELVEGTDLRRVRKQGPLPVGLAVAVAAEVLKGLAHAHEATDAEGRSLGIVHRDLSPQNVLLSWGGVVKITDFGIAQGAGEGGATETGLIKGNPGYMSPEQIEGTELDGRTDVYTVGVLLHELLSGEPLYAKPGRSTRSMLAQVLLGRAPAPSSLRPEIPQPLSDYVLRLMAHERDARPPTAQDALKELLALELAPATATLDLVEHLKTHRRAVERPTLLEGEPAAAPVPAAEVVPVTAEVSDPMITPMPVALPQPAPWEALLPWVTSALGLLVVSLLGFLLYPVGEQEAGPSASGGPTSTLDGAVPAQDALQASKGGSPIPLAPAVVIEVDAGVPVDARPARHMRRAPRSEPRRVRPAAADAGAPPQPLKAVPSAPVPAKSSPPAKNEGLLDYSAPSGLMDYQPPQKP